MKTITLRQLERLGACDSHRERFAETFGDSAGITLDNARKAIEANLNIYWLVDIATPPATQSLLRAILNEADRRRADAGNAALRQWSLHDRDYPTAVDAANEAYHTAIVEASAARDEAYAVAFLEAVEAVEA